MHRARASSVVPICRGGMGNAAIFRPTHDFPIPVVGADDPVRPSKSGVFPWSFVGADAHIGPLKCCEFASDFRETRQFRRADRVVRPSKSGVFPWSFVGADAHIGPSKYCDFTSDFHINKHFPRADRVVRPYGAKGEINMDSPENHHKTGAFGGSMWASTPTA